MKFKPPLDRMMPAMITADLHQMPVRDMEMLNYVFQPADNLRILMFGGGLFAWQRHEIAAAKPNVLIIQAGSPEETAEFAALSGAEVVIPYHHDTKKEETHTKAREIARQLAAKSRARLLDIEHGKVYEIGVTAESRDEHDSGPGKADSLPLKNNTTAGTLKGGCNVRTRQPEKEEEKREKRKKKSRKSRWMKNSGVIPCGASCLPSSSSGEASWPSSKPADIHKPDWWQGWSVFLAGTGVILLIKALYRLRPEHRRPVGGDDSNRHYPSMSRTGRHDRLVLQLADHFDCHRGGDCRMGLFPPRR